MIQFVSLLWILALFWAVFGFLRGWYREVVVTASILVSTFILVQADAILRGIILVRFSRDQVFIVQMIIFMTIVYFAASQQYGSRQRQRDGFQAGVIGAVVGAINGYLVGGTLWYFMDVNEYPFSTVITAPAPGTTSANFVATLPAVILNGGITGSGEFFLIFVLLLIVMVLMAL